MRKWVVLLTCISALVAVNFGIFQKEQLLAEGQLVLLELAPVDPRSLMQGDYMALNYAIAAPLRQALDESKGSGMNVDGYLIVTLDQHSLARFKRLHDSTPQEPDEIKLRYRIRNGELRFASNAYFFQEGHAQRFEEAEYGAFRVNDEGEMLLIGLRDEQRQPLGLDIDAR